jgi:uncharacterized protein (TIGR03435 family)
MKKSMLKIIALAALSCGALFGQDITGSWQGTLTPPGGARELRIVFKISKGDAGALKAVMYSIDQQAPGLAGTAALQGSTVKMTIPGIGGGYEGKLDSDGVFLAGNFTQGAASFPLTLKHVTEEAAWPIPAPPAAPKPMAADANPVFAAASLKPSDPSAQGKGFTVRGSQFMTINTSLADMIVFAYGVHPRQIVGGPAWLESDKYDLVAKPDGEGMPNDKQWKVMIQKMLADRFKLTFHHDTRELSVYALEVGKSGPKLTKSEGDPNGLPGLFFRGLGDLPVRNANMADFAGVMQSTVLDRPVVDHTGITGRYDFTLKWTPDEFQFAGLGIKPPPPTGNAAEAPDLFNAIQEQLGLKLTPTKASADVLVVDHVEKPSAN